MSIDKISILGAGGWGTALAVLLSEAQRPLILWGHDPAHVEELRSTRTNPTYLPGVTLPRQVEPTNSLAAAAAADLIVVVVPSRALRSVADRLAKTPPKKDAVLLSCTKGIEFQSGKRMSEILAGHFPENPVAVLSGPSHAEEVSRGMPTAVVLGAACAALTASLQQLFSRENFRAYTSTDIAGIELGGALKNIFAIAAGVSDGLGLGDNSKAALVTRSLAELIRLGVAMGGRRETFQGLSGIGDLMVTCFSRHSRNRKVGERLGRGESIDAITASMKMVAEGVPTTQSAFECARRLGISTPIIDQVHAILFERHSPQKALRELMSRDPRPEEDLT